MPRKPRPRNTVRTEKVLLSLTVDELARLQRAADHAGEYVASFVRKLALRTLARKKGGDRE